MGELICVHPRISKVFIAIFSVFLLVHLFPLLSPLFTKACQSFRLIDWLQNLASFCLKIVLYQTSVIFDLLLRIHFFLKLLVNFILLIFVVVLGQIWVWLVVLGIFVVRLIKRVILKLHSSSIIVSCDKEASIVVFILGTLRLLGGRIIFQIHSRCFLIFLIVFDVLLLLDHFRHLLFLFLRELLIDIILILVENQRFALEETAFWNLPRAHIFSACKSDIVLDLNQSHAVSIIHHILEVVCRKATIRSSRLTTLMILTLICRDTSSSNPKISRLAGHVSSQIARWTQYFVDYLPTSLL